MTDFNASTAFDDLEDLDDLKIGGFLASGRKFDILDAANATDMPQGPQFKERCTKCRGTGRFGSYRDLGACFACKGKGFLMFKTSGAERAKSRAQAADRKVQKADDWFAAHPAETAWMKAKAGSFDFAASMLEAVTKYQTLTPNQLAAVQRCIAKDAARQADRAKAQEAEATRVKPTIAAEAWNALTALFAQAKARKLTLRLGHFAFTQAGAQSRNAGAIYVVDTEKTAFNKFKGETEKVYYGKIMGGAFERSRFSCDEVTEAEIAGLLSGDMAAAAVAYGRQTGRCSICNKTLENAESIARGIGPVCAGKMNW